MRKVVVVGHAGRGRRPGRRAAPGAPTTACPWSAACLAGRHACSARSPGVPVFGGLDQRADAVGSLGADTVAVLACPEMNGVRLRELAWELEKTGTDLCVAPALLDVAGPRTTIRPVAGLPLLHVDHPEFTGGKQVIKAAFDRAGRADGADPAGAAVRARSRWPSGWTTAGPAFFRQTRVGKDGQHVHGVQVPHHGGRRRAAQGRAGGAATRPTACCSRCARTRGSPGRAAGCAAGRWTSCRS